MTSADISFITCSVRDERYFAFKRSIDDMFAEDVQIIRIDDAISISEGYNRGVRMASGDIIIFCHDDIEFLNSNAPKYIMEDLVDFDIVGVAGTSRLSEGRWHTGGNGYVHGQVAHSCAERRDQYQICVYGIGRKAKIISPIQALDGLFFAVRRSVFDRISFDESFDGFHLYDLDFTYGAYLNGFRIAVDQRIHLLHHSGGRYDRTWERYYQRFNDKYQKFFEKRMDRQLTSIKRIDTSGKSSLDRMMTQINSIDEDRLPVCSTTRKRGHQNLVTN